jgi:hypothetical protein
MPNHFRGLREYRVPGLRRSRCINVFSVPNADDQNCKRLVADVTEDAVIAYPVTPQIFQLSSERASKPSWVGYGGDSLFQVIDDSLPNTMIEPLEFLQRGFGEINLPDQVCA